MSAHDVPTWYDLLGVEHDADSDQIRAAFRSATADLDPGTRRFELLSRAAGVLLDADKRRTYDAEVLGEKPTQPPEPTERPEPVAEEPAEPVPGQSEGVTPAVQTSRRTVPAWLLAVVGVLALAAVVWAVMAFRGSASTDEAAAEARSAAEKAVVPVLAYGAETLDADQKAAHAALTSSYRRTYDQMFELIRQNAPTTGTTVKVQVVDSGVVRASEDRVQVLLFVDRPTTNKTTPEPVVYQDQVTLTMVHQDGKWLVDDLRTTPVQGAG